MIKFLDLKLQPDIQKALDALGFTHPTEIQAQVIPILKSSNVDLHGQAQTGTGKTIAFGIPLIEQVTNGSSAFPEALIIAPTRELVVQIVENLKAVAQYKKVSIEPIYGGVSMIQQERALRKGAHIIVGTPGRLLDHLQRGLLKLHKIKTLVLDEADVMLDMGFKDDIDSLLKCIPTNRNIWLFSATVKDGINELKASHMKNPVVISISPKQITTANTKQYYVTVSARDRLTVLTRFIDCTPGIYGIIFTPTKVLADEVTRDLSKRGYEVEALHGDMSQSLRNTVIKRFKEKKVNLLVATDVAARGIDVSGLTHVINYALPREEENYVHRIGRTGRAGNEGVAITFIAQAELFRLRRMAKRFRAEILPLAIPTMNDLLDVRIQKIIDRMNSACRTAHGVPTQVVNQLHATLDAYSKEELINGMMTLCASSLKNISSDKIASQEISHNISPDENQRELMLTVGTLDGLSQHDVLKFIVESKQVERKDIKKLRVIKKRSYVTVSVAHAEQLALALQNKKLAGRTVQVRFV